MTGGWRGCTVRSCDCVIQLCDFHPVVGGRVSAAPEVPGVLQSYSKHSDSITVEFTEVSGATGYILRAESPTHEFFSETVVSGSPGTVVQLRPYTDYRLSVMSVNSGGRSQPSYPLKARTGTNFCPRCLGAMMQTN